MAWPARTASDVFSGDEVKTLGQDLYDRDEVISLKASTWIFVETNFTTTLADVSNYRVRLPAWTLNSEGAVIRMRFQAKRDGAVSGNANFRLRETVGPNNGTTLNTALTTAWATYQVAFTVPDDTWAESVELLALQAQRPASGADGDWFIRTSTLVSNFWVDI